jgi:lipopolysaccharide cholinephosphotransferase
MLIRLKDIQKIETKMLNEVNRICQENNITYYLVCGSVLGAIRHGGPIPWDYDVDITVPFNQMERFIKVMDKCLPSVYRIATPAKHNDIASAFPRIAVNGISAKKVHIDVFPSIGITDDKEEQIKHLKYMKRLNKLHFYKSSVKTRDGHKLKVLFKKTILRLVMLPFSERKLQEKLDALCAKFPYESAKYVTNPYGGYGMKNIVPKEYFGEPLLVNYDGLMLPIPNMYKEYLKHYYNDYMKYPSKEEQEKYINIQLDVDEELFKKLI